MRGGGAGIPSNARPPQRKRESRLVQGIKRLPILQGTKITGNWLKFERHRLICLRRPSLLVVLRRCLKTSAKNHEETIKRKCRKHRAIYLTHDDTLSIVLVLYHTTELPFVNYCGK